MSTRDFRDVYASLKDFQLATVDHVVRRLFDDEETTDRFLVADEVGLGKTLVARGVIARTIEHHLERGTRRIDIVYICSNGDIARQNINRLNVLERGDVQLASRITLLPRILHQLEQHRVNFVSFTPGTSFNLRSSEGVAEERAVLYHLLTDIWPDLMGFAGARKALAGWSGFRNFQRRLDWMSRDDLDDSMAAGFRRALADAEATRTAGASETYRALLEDLNDRLRYTRRNTPSTVDEDTRRLRRELVGGLREILAKVCVDALEPDLVILDEFQRFKHVFDDERPEGELANRLFNYEEAEGHRAKVLLLSATPYKMYTLSDEVDEDHYADFLDTMKFLLPPAEVEALATDLRDYRRTLWRVGEGDGSDALAVRERIESRLRRVMARTERLAVTADRDGMLVERPAAKVDLRAADVRTYLGLEQISEEINSYGVLPYWLSAAYPLNFMDRYQLDKRLDAELEAGPSKRLTELLSQDGLLLPWKDVEAYREVDPGNARLRSLLADTVGAGMWQMLWLRPALPYYELGEPFNQPELEGTTKRLVFSSWAVAPRVIAALGTYEAERRMMRSYSPDIANTPDARNGIAVPLPFPVREGRPERMSSLGLLYASTALAELGDPLRHAAQVGAVGEPVARDVLLRRVGDELRDRLQPWLGDAPPDGGEDQAWYWAAPLLLDHAMDGDDYLHWFQPEAIAEGILWTEAEEHGDEPVSSGLVRHYEEARRLLTGERAPLGRPPEDLFEVLAELAIAGPGVVALRALRRSGIQDEVYDGWHARDYAGHVAWSLRSLFNEPEVQYLLRSSGARGRREDAYWRLVLRYCFDGCLQAVMDEYMHTLVESLGVADLEADQRFNPIISSIREVLGMRTVTYRVRRLEVDGDGVQRSDGGFRGHFALRFGDERSDDDKSLARSSTVRKAFNSPFRPFVLATTSVGQEGLDFHTYCHAVVHWNLPSNPVDMEQREGRVHRYKGHAVRKNVASRHRASAFHAEGDPWKHLFDAAAADRAVSDNELVPYWVYPIEDGAKIERYVPALPLSRDARQLERLRRSMAAYRLVFGQPRQEDLVAFLSQRLDTDELAETLDNLRINLTPAPLHAGRRDQLTTEPRIGLPPSAAENGDESPEAGTRPRREEYRLFWADILEEVGNRYPGWTTRKAPAKSWLRLPTGVAGFGLNLVFADRNRLRLELYVDPHDEDLRERAWDELTAARDDIEARFGEELTWEPLPQKRAARIAFYFQEGAVDISERNHWKAYRTWLLENIGRFRDAVQPTVDALRDW